MDKLSPNEIVFGTRMRLDPAWRMALWVNAAMAKFLTSSIASSLRFAMERHRQRSRRKKYSAGTVVRVVRRESMIYLNGMGHM